MGKGQSKGKGTTETPEAPKGDAAVANVSTGGGLLDVSQLGEPTTLPDRTRNTQARKDTEAIIEALSTRNMTDGQFIKVGSFDKRSTASARARMFKEYEGVTAEVRGSEVYVNVPPAAPAQ